MLPGSFTITYNPILTRSFPTSQPSKAPSEIEINHESGIKTKITKRIILSEYTEYYVSLGKQELKIQAPHHQVLAVGDECYIRLVNPVYYDAEERNLTHAE